MTDYLERAIKRHLESTRDDSAVAIESRSDIPKGSLSHILRGHTPRVERLAQLLRAMPDTTAREWLAAYLRDHTPEEWQPRTHIEVDPISDRLAEPLVHYGTRDRLTETLEWLRNRTAGDDDLAEWLIDTVALMRGMISTTDAPPGYGIAHIPVTDDEAALIRAAASRRRQSRPQPAHASAPNGQAHTPEGARETRPADSTMPPL